MHRLEKEQRDAQISYLMDELRKYESQEQQATKLLSTEYNLVDNEVAQLLDMTKRDDDHLQHLESLMQDDLNKTQLLSTEYNLVDNEIA